MCLAVPGKILQIDENGPLRRAGRVDFSGIVKNVNLAYVSEAVVGDFVIVHVGFAISRVDAEEAAKVFQYLKQMDDLTELTSTEERRVTPS
jgi:hydrogenase expression/formation protein HypC